MLCKPSSYFPCSDYGKETISKDKQIICTRWFKFLNHLVQFFEVWLPIFFHNDLCTYTSVEVDNQIEVPP